MTESRNQRLRRARPVLALAVVAFAFGAVLGARHTASPAFALADQFVKAWTRRDYVTMYSDISASSRRSMSASEFANAYQEALTTATVTRADVTGGARGASGGAVAVPVRVDTRLFGTLSLDFTLRTVGDATTGTRIAWSRLQIFPGLREGELLARNMTMPRRATLLARDGSVLAESAAGAPASGQPAEVTRSSPLGKCRERRGRQRRDRFPPHAVSSWKNRACRPRRSSA